MKSRRRIFITSSISYVLRSKTWRSKGNVQRAFLPAARAFRHRAFAIVDSFALAAADIFRLSPWPGLTEAFAALAIAILFRTPARMFARPWGLILVLFLVSTAPHPSG